MFNFSCWKIVKSQSVAFSSCINEYTSALYYVQQNCYTLNSRGGKHFPLKCIGGISPCRFWWVQTLCKPWHCGWIFSVCNCIEIFHHLPPMYLPMSPKLAKFCNTLVQTLRNADMLCKSCDNVDSHVIQIYIVISVWKLVWYGYYGSNKCSGYCYLAEHQPSLTHSHGMRVI